MILLFISLSTIKLEDFLITLQKLKVEMVIISIIFFLTFYLIRGVRWAILLRPVKNSVSLINTFRITIIGYFVNTLIPIRIGEFVRAIILNRKERIGIFEGLSSIAVERILDLFSISLIGFTTLLFLPSNITYPSWFIDGLTLIFTFALIAIVGVIIATIMQIKFLSLVERLLNKLFIIPNKWREKIFNSLKSILEGASGLSQGFSLVTLSFILSLSIWMVYTLSFYFIFEAFTCELHWSIIILGATLMAASFIFPAAPGFLGTFEAAWMVIFLFGFNLPAEILMPIGFFTHLINVLVAVIPGYLCVMWMGIKGKELFQSK